MNTHSRKSEFISTAPDEKDHRRVYGRIPHWTSASTPAKNTINPSLASHGGFAKLEDATDDGIIKVSFTGGCRGCSMVNVTLKEGIEANLKQAFPGMIKEVIDITDHEVTSETYTNK